MVQFSNNTTIINPIALGANRAANILCPKLIMEDVELTLTLKLLETKLYNLCIEQNTYKLLTSNSSIAELIGKTERTARGYISKLIKLGKIRKLPCKEKGKYYLVFISVELMQLNTNEIIIIDENFNLVSQSPSQDTTTLTLPFATCYTTTDEITNTSSTSFNTKVEQSPSPVIAEPQIIDESLFASIRLSEVEEAEKFYSELNENQEDELLGLCSVVEENWLKSGKLAQAKKDWLESPTTTRDHWENYLTEQILLQIKLDYAREVKEMLADDSLNDDEAKNAAIFSLTTNYEQSLQLEQELEQVEVVEQAETQLATKYLLEAVGQSHPVSFNQIATSSDSNNNSNKTEFFSANSSNFSNTKNLANSCQNSQEEKSNIFDDKTNLANFCQTQNSRLNEEFVSNTQERIEQRKKHMLKGFENNDQQKLALAKPNPTKPHGWEQGGGSINNNLDSIIKTIIANVGQAKVGQNIDSETNQDLTSDEESFGNSLPSDSNSTNPAKNLGNSLPNNSDEIKDLALIEARKSRAALYPKSLKPKSPPLKNYFWNIE